MNKLIAFDDEHDIYELVFELKRTGAVSVKGRVVVVDILCINFDEADDTYCVHNLDGSEKWVGIDADKNTAILKYLATRLGVELPLQGGVAAQEKQVL